MESEPLRVLVICTANICRSPMAEFMLRHLAGLRDLPMLVESAGFLYDGEPASPRVVEVMKERGIDVGAHRSRTLNPSQLGDADLIVTMERRHGRDAVAVAPAAIARIHTFGRLVKALGQPGLARATSPRAADAARGLLAAVGDGRDAAELLGVGDDEIADPFGRSLRIHRATANRLDELCSALIDALFGAPATPHD